MKLWHLTHWNECEYACTSIWCVLNICSYKLTRVGIECMSIYLAFTMLLWLLIQIHTLSVPSRQVFQFFFICVGRFFWGGGLDIATLPLNCEEGDTIRPRREKHWLLANLLKGSRGLSWGTFCSVLYCQNLAFSAFRKVDMWLLRLFLGWLIKRNGNGFIL